MLYTCIGKGGIYQLLGTAIGAGTSRELEPMVIYKCVQTQQLYMRTYLDFEQRMELLTLDEKRNFLCEYVEFKAHVKFSEDQIDDLIQVCGELSPPQ